MSIVQICTVSDQVCFSIGRMFHIPAEIDKVGRAYFYRMAIQTGFAKQGIFRGMRSFCPCPAIVGGIAESYKWPEPGPVVNHFSVLCLAGRIKAIGSVVPYPVQHQASGRVSSMIGKGWGMAKAQTVYFKRHRVISFHYRLSGGSSFRTISEGYHTV